MAGTVYRRSNGIWSVKIELGRDPATGKRRQKMVGGFRTRKEAEQARTQLLHERDKGTLITAPKNQTVGEFLTEWLAAIEPTVKASTHHSYSRNMRLHVIPRIGRVRLQQLDPGILTGLYAGLLRDGHQTTAGTGLAPRTVRYIGVVISRSLSDAVAWGRIARNPATAAKSPSASQTNSGPPNTWSGTQLRQFLELCQGCQDRYYPAWVLLASTGARRGEVLGLRWTDLDLEAGRMKVVQQLCLVGHEVRIEQPKTHRSQRPISLDPSTVAVLRRWKADQAAERLLMGAGYRDLGLVNCHPDGHPYDPSRFSREFKRRIERWELSPLSVHGLRHTWATLALEAGVHPKVVQERLGHSTIAITLGTYSHVMPGMDAAAAALVAGEFLP